MAEFLTSLLNEKLKIVISDGRYFLGILTCVDKDANIVLVNVQEWIGEKDRFLPQSVIIEGKDIVKVFKI
jgi:small nuclear ribonucleoprotein (snRNP)-like protein